LEPESEEDRRKKKKKRVREKTADSCSRQKKKPELHLPGGEKKIKQLNMSQKGRGKGKKGFQGAD